MPPTPPAPADPLRAVAVALLNLSGLGIGYALIRRRFAMAVCWLATAALLLVALPADPDGVPRGALVGYLVLLALAAAHGAVRGLRTRLAWPPQAPVAALLGLVLLAVPTGGVLLYGNARDEAVEQALLDRLHEADTLVQDAKNEPFGAAEPDFTDALATYRDLDRRYPDSRAGKLVPDRLERYYEAVATPYDRKKYCDAIEPLEYLRKVPDSISRQRLGHLAAWPDDRLATSFYECGIDDLGSGDGTGTRNGTLARLLTTFPRSPQAAKVEPVLSDRIDAAVKDLGGDEPCAANDRLRTLGTQAADLPGDRAGIADALSKDADRAGEKVRSGTYACGVDQYEDGDFDKALDTLNDFTRTYKHDGNRDRAKKIAIAAEIARSIPAAGKHLPSSGSGGSIPVTIKNDSPDEIEILYTGPVTGSIKIPACHGCSTYFSDAAASLSACKDSGRHYPSKTIHLPAGTTYFLHKPTDGSTSVGTDTAKIDPGYVYTECAYVVQSFGSGYSS
ncbi:hypothetical protein [Streptomyces sulfonofaciens]|uniref:hypothetical protein n=1 Tax=Streptomyces sulfonofaciens TaxID=68272 RepID=UPI001679EBC2|nr:hypothetical protein [Streptomyces sulfonofaciens]